METLTGEASAARSKREPEPHAGVIKRHLVGAARRAFTHADDGCDEPRYFSRCIKLPLRFAGFCSEVLHQVFVGIAQNIVSIDTVGREIQLRTAENGKQPGKFFLLFPGIAQFVAVIEIRHINVADSRIGRRDFLDHLVHLVAQIVLVADGVHVIEACAPGNHDQGSTSGLVQITDVFDEEQSQNIILVLGSVHAAAQFVAGRPE